MGWRAQGFLEVQWVSQGRLTKKKALAVTRTTLLSATCPRLEDRAVQGAGPSAGQTALAACGIDLDIDQMPLV